MNEANTLADITGHDEQASASDDGMRAAINQGCSTVPPAPDAFVLDEASVIGFCGYVTADIPELHGVHPQRIFAAWERFKGACRSGFFARDGEG
jgi:hypothetical protein